MIYTKPLRTDAVIWRISPGGPCNNPRKLPRHCWCILSTSDESSHPVLDPLDRAELTEGQAGPGVAVVHIQSCHSESTTHLARRNRRTQQAE